MHRRLWTLSPSILPLCIHYTLKISFTDILLICLPGSHEVMYLLQRQLLGILEEEKYRKFNKPECE